MPIIGNINNDSIRNDAPIILQVGEWRFTSSMSTLIDGSGYFKGKFSGRWKIETNSDGSVELFVDADPTIFRHILNFLRAGIKPLFWDKQNGFDYAKYYDLLQAANYFGVAGLEQWISSKMYERMVQSEEKMRFVLPTTGVEYITPTTDYAEYRVVEVNEHEYRCSNNHKSRDRCVRSNCSYMDKGNTQEISGTKIMIISTETKFDADPKLPSQGSVF